MQNGTFDWLGMGMKGRGKRCIFATKRKDGHGSFGQLSQLQKKLVLISLFDIKKYKQTLNDNNGFCILYYCVFSCAVFIINKAYLRSASIYIIQNQVMSQQTVLIKITSNFSIYEGKELGAGHYGRVFKGYHDQERKDVAVKIIQKEMLQKNQGLFVREIQVLIKLNSEVTHPNVVGLLGYTKKDEIGYLFFELCKDNLQNRLFNSLTEKEVIPYFKDILSGLVFLHSKQIIHRDLKPQNILIDDRDTLKIADFGLSRQFDPSNQLKMTDRVGNYAYQAPEVKTSHYDQRCDVWSLGLILYQLLTGTLCREYSIDSHQGIDKRNMDIKQKKFNLKFEGYEPIWERLLNKMLVYEYTNRPTSKQILDEFLHWEKQYNKPKTLFKTFAQYEDNIEQMRKTMRLEKKKTSERIKQEQKKQKFQQKPLNPPQKQSETEIMILSLRDEQYDSLVNFVSYLDYYHQYKIISQVIQCKIMQLVKSSPSLKQIYNSFSILTISFLMDTIVYLRYKQLLIEMNNLFMDHPDLKNQYNQIDAQKRIRFDRFVAQKKDKFNKFIIMFQTESSEKIKKRISYRQKIKLNENYISIFKFLEGIKIKQQPYESIIHHLQLFFIDPQFHFDETSFKTCSLEQLKMIYLFKKLHEVCQQMSGSFHMKTSLQLKNIRRGLENISIQSIQKYLANPEQ